MIKYLYISLAILLFVSILVFLCNKNNPESFNDCDERLVECVDEKCPNCSSDFTCTKVDQNGRYVFNGLNVPVGSYCLPSNSNDKKSCNAYTGKWVWASDKKGKQSWKCECLYPSLFGNDSEGNGGCTIPSCNGILVPTEAAPKDIKDMGKKGAWDPNYGESNVLRINPYTTTYDPYAVNQINSIKPWFKCDCSGLTDPGTLSNSLPGDPYQCILDTCTVNPGSVHATLSTGDVIYCNCENKSIEKFDVSTISEETTPEGTMKGTCFNPAQICVLDGVTYGWDRENQECACDPGKGIFSVYCENSQYGLKGEYKMNPDGTVGNIFQCPGNNFVGRQCYNGCSGFNCNKKGKCFPKRIRDSSGKIIVKPECKCDTDNDAQITYTGAHCESFCYNKGKQIGTQKMQIDCSGASGACTRYSYCDFDLGIEKSKCCSGDVDEDCKCN